MSAKLKPKKSDDFRITWVNPAQINGRYQVIWEVESDEDTPQKAADEAWSLMRWKHSGARYFTVIDKNGHATKVFAESNGHAALFGPPNAMEVEA